MANSPERAPIDRSKSHGAATPSQPDADRSKHGSSGAPPINALAGPRTIRREYGTSWRINYRLIVVLSIVVVLFGLGVHLLHAFQQGRQTSSLLKQADRAEADGEFSLAARYLRRYLNYRRDDVDRMERLALLLDEHAENVKDRFLAYLEMEEVIRRDPSRHEVRRRLVRVAVDFRRFTDAMSHLLALQEVFPDDGELHFLMGCCREGQSDFEAAAASYARSVEQAPDLLDAYLRLASIERLRFGQPRAADRVLDRMVAANEESPQAWLNWARYRRAAGDIHNAAADVRAAQVLAPEDLEVHLLAGELAAIEGEATSIDREATERQLTRLLNQHPDEPRVYRVLAVLELSKGRYDEAERWLIRGLEQLPDDLDLHMSLCRIMIERGKIDDARRQMDQILNTRASADDRQSILMFLEGNILLTERRWREAKDVLEDVFTRLSPEAPDAPATVKTGLWLAHCYWQLGNPNLEIAAYRRLLELNPDCAEARFGLARALVGTAAVDDALVQYRMIAHLPGIPMQIAELLLETNAQRSPDKRRWKEFESMLNAARVAAPDSPQIPILEAAMHQLKGDLASAGNVLDQARQNHADDVEIWVESFVTTWLDRDAAAARSLLDEAQGRLGDRVELRLLAADLAGVNGNDDPFLAIAKLEQDREKFSVPDQIRLLRGLAAAYRERGKLDEWTRLLGLSAGLDADNLVGQVQLFDAALMADNLDAARSALTEIERIDGKDGPYRRCCQASLLIYQSGRGDETSVGEARRLLDLVARDHPDWPLVWLHRGFLAEQRGDREEAIACYRKAFDRRNDHPLIAERLITLLMQTNRPVEADDVFRNLEARRQLPPSSQLSRLGAEFALRAGDTLQAMRLAQRAVQLDAGDAQSQLLLGRALTGMERHDQAAGPLRRSTQLDPGLAAAWVALVKNLAAAGHADQARAAIDEAQAHLAAGDLPLVLAECYEALGQVDLSGQQYETALTARGDDPVLLRAAVDFSVRHQRDEQAIALLRRLQQAAGADTEVVRARRQLAVLLSRGSYTDYLEGLKLVDQNMADRTDPADRLLKAQLLLIHPRPEHLREALEHLQTLHEADALNPDDQILMAKIADMAAEPIQAEQMWNALVQSDPNRPELAVAYVRRLLQQSRATEAAFWTDRLASVEDLPEAAVLAAELYARGGRVEQSVGHLKKWVDRADRPPEKLERIRRAARVWEELVAVVPESMRPAARARLLREAELSYDTLAENGSGDVLLQAEFLARTGRVDEAFQLCDRAWEQLPVESVAETCGRLLYTAAVHESHIEQVDRRLSAAVDENPQSTELLLHLANLRDLQGQYEETELLLRRIVERDDKHVIARNNLAWLLTVWRGKPREAAELISKAVELAGPKPSLADTQALALLALGQPKQAVTILRRALSEQDLPILRYHLALAFQAEGNRATATAQMRLAEKGGLNEGMVHPLEREAYRRLSTGR